MPALQTFRQQIRPVPIPTQNFDQIASPPTKHKHVSRNRILLQRWLHQPAQPDKTTPHVGHPGDDPDLRSCWYADHFSRHSNSTRSELTSVRPVIRRYPLGSSTWIVPDGTEGGSSLLARAAALTAASETLPRTSLHLLLFSPTRPSRSTLRHRKSWFALMPCR